MGFIKDRECLKKSIKKSIQHSHQCGIIQKEIEYKYGRKIKEQSFENKE